MIDAKSRRSEIVVMLFALALPFKAGGCGTTTCITLTQQQVMSGMCPSQAAAQMRVTVTDNSTCSFNSTVTILDGEGVLDGELCCYPSSKQGGVNGCFGGGFGGGVTFTTSTGFGGGTTTGVCAPCNNSLQGAPF